MIYPYLAWFLKISAIGSRSDESHILLKKWFSFLNLFRKCSEAVKGSKENISKLEFHFAIFEFLCCKMDLWVLFLGWISWGSQNWSSNHDRRFVTKWLHVHRKLSNWELGFTDLHRNNFIATFLSSSAVHFAKSIGWTFCWDDQNNGLKCFCIISSDHLHFAVWVCFEFGHFKLEFVSTSTGLFTLIFIYNLNCTFK